MFRFTIRELVLLTLVVAISVGWWMSQRNHEASFLRLSHYAQRQRQVLTAAKYEQREMAVKVENLVKALTDSFSGKRPDPREISTICRVEEPIDWKIQDEPIPGQEN